MKMFNTKSILTVLGVSLVLCLTGTITAFAATAPTLGVATGYGVFGVAGVTETPAQDSHIWGDVGGNGAGIGNLIAGQVGGTLTNVLNVPVVNAIASAYSDLAAVGQGVATSLDLAGGGNVGPGLYDVAATTLDGVLTLDGAGVYIFRSTSSITVSGGSMNLINGATACNVFWQIPTSMTITSAAHMEGTIITDTGLISFVSGASLVGRAWAHTQVTMDNNQITEPVCAVVPPVPPSSVGTSFSTINVVKTVINDNGGTKKVSDFPLFVNGSPVISGDSNLFTQYNSYTVTETSNPKYTRTFSGDCDINGNLFLQSNDQKFCIITNNDIGAPAVVPPVPPLIDVVKVPNPLSLPKGSGPVQYTYTVRNVGPVPMTDVTMVGDTCSPIKLISGDTNSDSKLDLSETWVYTCTTTLTATHTNTVVATGWANGISATDIASATVVVGATVPPLIHVTKVPSPLTLLEGGGMVTYTEKITNPGTVALSNVKLTDDKCSPMKYISGDTNNNSKLESTETWTYTCRAYLSETTTNTATATGEANGITVKDLAIAIVVVAAPAPVVETPKLPNTGFGPSANSVLPSALASGIFAISLLIYIIRKKENV